LSIIPFPSASSPKPFPKKPTSATLTAANSCIVPRKDFEAVARRRFQNPKPKKIGNWWWTTPWADTWIDGKICRKRQRTKVAPAETGVREVQKIAAELMRAQKQGLESIGSVTVPNVRRVRLPESRVAHPFSPGAEELRHCAA
jgi:hypothetical protein